MRRCGARQSEINASGFNARFFPTECGFGEIVDLEPG
jgi:hypothetical protein